MSTLKPSPTLQKALLTASRRSEFSDGEAAPRSAYVAMPTSAAELDRLWKLHREAPSQGTRNKLMECYLHLVRYVADRLRAKISDQVDVEDMISSGIFGLLEAVEGFDPSRGWKFETYCLHRIRGAILDEIRHLDWAPRLVRRRTNRMLMAATQLQARLGRKPTREELFKHMGLSKEEFVRLLRDSQNVGMVPLSRSKPDDRGRERREGDNVPDRNPDPPHRQIHRDDLKQLLLSGLSRQDRLVLELYYYEKMSMKEIGMILNLSESRVSQLHTEIMAQLRRRLAGRQADLVDGGVLA